METSLIDRRVSQSPPFYAARSNRLRVAIVSDAIASRNGVGTYYADLVEHLKAHVQSVCLIGPDTEPNAVLEWFSIEMPGDSTQRMAWPRRRRLFEMLDAQRPNVVIVPSLGGFAYNAMVYARKRRVPVAVVNHTNFEELARLYVPYPWDRPASWTLHRLGHWLIRRATAVAAMNSESLDSARRAGVGQIRVMGTPLAPEFLTEAVRPLGDSLHRAVFVGRLAKEKCILRFLRAAEEIPEMEFTIAGDGPMRRVVEQAATRLPNVRFVGWVGRGQVLEEIDRAQILVLPSDIETFGTVALEALARQRYVLTNKNCGISKWPSIASGLFTFGGCESVAQTLQEIRRMLPEARIAHARHSWNAVRSFNQNTIRVWTSFLVDAASSCESFAQATEGLRVAS